MALAAVVLLAALAWLAARTTVYSITSKRIVMRIGIALPITINVPFRAVNSVGLKRHADGSGDIPASLPKGYRLAFLVLWPHARPWHVRNPQPMLRSVPDASASRACCRGHLGRRRAGAAAAAAGAARARSTARPARVGIRAGSAAA